MDRTTSFGVSDEFNLIFLTLFEIFAEFEQK